MLSDFFPPPYIWITEIAAICALLAFAVAVPANRQKLNLLAGAFVLAVVATIGMGLIAGYGHTWNVASAIGKFLSMLIAVALPIFIAATAFLVSLRLKATVPVAAFVSVAAGLVATLPIMVVAIVLVCSITGDCL